MVVLRGRPSQNERRWVIILSHILLYHYYYTIVCNNQNNNTTRVLLVIDVYFYIYRHTCSMYYDYDSYQDHPPSTNRPQSAQSSPICACKSSTNLRCSSNICRTRWRSCKSAGASDVNFSMAIGLDILIVLVYLGSMISFDLWNLDEFGDSLACLAMLAVAIWGDYMVTIRFLNGSGGRWLAYHIFQSVSTPLQLPYPGSETMGPSAQKLMAGPGWTSQ